jgi:hypothetical protein
MKVKAKFATQKETKWHEYAVRFLLGGGITVVAGIIADKFGPAIGGLFLAFPAIFPASATLIEKHQKQKKEKAGVNPGNRGRQAAGLDAAGSMMGSIGLAAFAISAWLLLRDHGVWLALSGSLVAWTIVSIGLWKIGDRIHWRRLRTNRSLRSGTSRPR